MTTKKKDIVDYRKMVGLLGETCFISKVEPKDVKTTLLDEHWINAMQEELFQFEKNDVCELVPRPDDYNVIGKKWIFKNKSDEFGNVTRNKARLVAQGYTQIEGIDFEETFAPVERLLLWPALYGLKQAPRAGYERLTIFLLKNGYIRGGVDNTLFIMKEKDLMMVAQIYIDDIVFGDKPDEGQHIYLTILATHVKVSKDEDGKSVDISAYKSMIGSLFNLIASKPNIAYYVGVCKISG
ncbi:hypothetical protein LIER_35099 [Lithospermum erythrorhizon]|uniref:Reverse transcriptase Ty1/copia-type domain-containing protein n=1 Tax=Lithospermum erythrorhizon TaxID=34254 RepID=A0AAV3NN40_LITER